MEKQAYSKKTVILCAVCLTVIAAASFVAMNAFTRPVFGNNRDWQVCFLVLAVCLIVSAAVKKSAIVLAISAAAAVGMYFYTPFYGALFFPVALQAALWEAAREETTGGRVTFAVALVLVPATIPLRVRWWQFMSYNAQSDGKIDSIIEACVCLAGLLLLLALWALLLSKSVRKAAAAKKKPAKKRGRDLKKTPGGSFLPVVYAVCALHTALVCVSFIQLFSGVYVRTLFLANALFVGYLLFRQEQTLCEWRQKIINQMT